MNIMVWIIFGALAGWLASIIMDTNREQGALANVAIGVGGALIGGFLSQALGNSGVSGLNLLSLIVAVVGAVFLIGIIRLATR